MTISASDVKKLRDMTGAGMMDAKKALSERAFLASIIPAPVISRNFFTSEAEIVITHPPYFRLGLFYLNLLSKHQLLLTL